MKESINKYALGLDIGTNSVGWALVDQNNDIVVKNGFTMWGVRMFDKSSDSKDRRTYRESRRRLNRRKQRINWLQGLFKDEVNKVDPNFFTRLNDSFFKIEDKSLKNKYTLFNDEKTDKDYFDLYPTIYHLRSHLINSFEKEDIRYIYLALHHIIKYRGNFLQEGETFNKNNIERIKECFNEINDNILNTKNDFEDDEDYFDIIKNINNGAFYNQLERILSSDDSKRDKKAKLLELFNVESKSFVNEFVIPLLCGSTVKANKLRLVKDMKYEDIEIDLSSEELEKKIEEAKTTIIELSNIFDITLLLKEVKDYYYLLELLGKSNTLSEAMVYQYDMHHKDLEILKSFIRKYVPSKYNECFKVKNENLCNYCSYIGYNNV